MSIISPTRAGVRYGLDTRTIAAPMRIAASRATTVVESSGDLVAWRWPSGVQLERVSRRDMEKAAETLVHLAMIREVRA